MLFNICIMFWWTKHGRNCQFIFPVNALNFLKQVWAQRHAFYLLWTDIFFWALQNVYLTILFFSASKCCYCIQYLYIANTLCVKAMNYCFRNMHCFCAVFAVHGFYKVHACKKSQTYFCFLVLWFLAWSIMLNVYY